MALNIESSNDERVIVDDLEESGAGGVGERLRVAGVTESGDGFGSEEKIGGGGDVEKGAGEVSLGEDEKAEEEKDTELENSGLNEGLGFGGDVNNKEVDLYGKKVDGVESSAAEFADSKVGVDVESAVVETELGGNKHLDGVVNAGDDNIGIFGGDDVKKSAGEGPLGMEEGQENDIFLENSGLNGGMGFEGDVSSLSDVKNEQKNRVQEPHVGDSSVKDVNVDLPGSGVAIVGNHEESRGSDDGDKDAAVIESVNVNNHFSQINSDIEEPLKLKSEGAEPEFVTSDENAEVELSGQESAAANFAKEDAEEVRKSVHSVEEQHQNGGTSPLDDNELFGMVDGRENLGPPIYSKHKPDEATLETHVPAGEEDESEEKLGASNSQNKEAEQAALPRTDVVNNLEDESSEFAQQRDSGDSKMDWMDGVNATSVGDSIVEDTNVDLSDSGVAIVGNVEESRGSDKGVKNVAVNESMNVDNQFSQMNSDVEEPLELKSDGVDPESVRSDENAELELSEQTSGTVGCASEDAEGVCKITDSVEKQHQNGGTSLLDDNEFSGMDDSKDNLGLSIDSKVKISEATLGTHVPSARPISSAREDKSESIQEKFDASNSQIKEDEQTALPLPETDSGENLGDEISEFAQQREVKLNAGDIQKQYPEEESESETIQEKFDASNSQIKEAEQSALPETDSGKNLEGEISEFAEQREVKPNVGDIQKQYPDEESRSESIQEKFDASNSQSKEEFPQHREVKPNGEDIQKQYSESIQENYNYEASNSQIKQAEQTTPHKTDYGKNLGDETSEFAQQRGVKPNVRGIQKQGESEAKETEVDEECEGLVFESSEDAKQFIEELEQGSSLNSRSGIGSSRDHQLKIDGEIVTDSEEEESDSDEDQNGGNELFDSAALTALLRAATGESSNGGSVTLTSQDGARLFSDERPAGLGSSIRSFKPASRPVRHNIFTSTDLTPNEDSENTLTEEEQKKLEKLQQIRIKFLRLLHRLDYSPDDSMVGQVLYRLSLMGGMQSGQLFNLESAKTTALQLESDGKGEFDFSLNVLVIGKIGTGKSATVNSIFGEVRSQIDAFEAATNTVHEIIGTVDGIKIRIFDTPGLRSSALDQNFNRKILLSIRKFIKKCPPDVVLYVDRLDTQTKDLTDVPLLRSITNSLGPSIWRNAIVTLTHAASAPPDGPSGSPQSYEVFVAQRSHIVQQSIGQAVGDLRMMNPSLMNPVSLVENHISCRKNKVGQKVLPNGQSWRPQLLLLCYSLKILSEANSLSKTQSRVDQKKLFGFRVRSPPLPYILSWLLQSRTHPKLSTDQGIDNGDVDIDFVDLSDSEEDEEDDYDQLPPFMPLKKAQLAVLSKEQKQAYFEEYDYRVKLLQKKQLKEELKRIREIKKKKIDGDTYTNSLEDVDQDDGAPATVPVPLPDMTLPASFDGDNPAYRYRFLEPTSQFLARPVLDTHGWDHDCGYDGVNIEQSLAIASQFPTALAVQLTKDKKEFNIHFDSSIAGKHGENGSTMAGFDIQHVGKQLGYTLRGETKFKNLKINKTAAGVSITFLGDNIVTGFKVEDQITLGKRLMLVGSTGTVRSQGDAAYGTNLEVRLREADYPIGQNESSLGLSLVKWKGDLALGANLQSQFFVGRNSKVAVRMGLNNKRSGQISIRTSSSDQLQIALVGIIPIVMAIYKTIRPGVSDNYSLY